MKDFSQYKEIGKTTNTMRLTKVALPTKLVETIDEGIVWLETLRQR